MNKSAQENFDFIDDILEEISPVEMKKIEQRMLNAEKIRKAMDAKGWNNTKLLEALNMKSPSIITKWLSGTHNFTQDTLVEIGEVLEINFFETIEQKITIEFSFPVLENKTDGFDSFSSLDYILNSNQINLSNSFNNCTEYRA
ncbi:XRE family transcriptional regulator [Aquimarina sp. AD1]|uniref:helix-turn-helix domain-containing protein n=1 Tax=Aquimarina sp. (strain AD1) TaxID=1714848 RepID=UPI000E5570DB|nr:helix-turn-helix transcriptional regulator [Aquimarina sp. AD1]AXT54445.1 XRE family transcriptional regulator [Aquimarina sp. AD1]RKN36745.1 helix-turn-helix domain-containing protein [Aquimarina sp. AD1]